MTLGRNHPLWHPSTRDYWVRRVTLAPSDDGGERVPGRFVASFRRATAATAFHPSRWSHATVTIPTKRLVSKVPLSTLGIIALDRAVPANERQRLLNGREAPQEQGAYAVSDVLASTEDENGMVHA